MAVCIRSQSFGLQNRYGFHVVVKRQSLPSYVHKTEEKEDTRLRFDDPRHFCLTR